MSKDALYEAQRFDRESVRRNDARRILQRVELAIQSPQSSGVRWPFELIQNAHDFGAREGEDYVEIEFCHRANNLIVAHNGRIFSIPELKALLSGGSSKEFKGIESTGRFGTGFLVTHAISSQVDVDGILQTEGGKFEIFRMELNRPPNEAQILDNIKETDQAFNAARPANGIPDIPTALFNYQNANPDVVGAGLDRLEQTVPYLFATCENLGEIRIRRPERTIVFRRESRNHTEPMYIDEFMLKYVIVVASDGASASRFIAMSILGEARDTIGAGEDTKASAGLLLILKLNDGEGNSIVLPEPGFPKIFVQFPISETGSLPFNAIFEGKFNPKQERDGISMNASDRALLQTALSTLPSTVEFAVSSGWGNAHKLALLDVPSQALGGEAAGPEELDWWREVTSEAAKAVGSKSIVSTCSGYLPALSNDGESACLLVPAADATRQFPIDYEGLYDLASRVTDVHLPHRTVARDWETIAGRWFDIGLPVRRMGLRELVDWVRKNSRTVSDLPIDGDPFEWLSDLLLLVADLPEDINKRPFLNGMLPDQKSELRGAADLRFDGGISDEVKDIAAAVGIDVKANLLHTRIVEVLVSPGYELARTLAEETLGQIYPESEAVEAVLDRLDERLMDDSSPSTADGPTALNASARLVAFLALKDENNVMLRRCPLLTAEDKVVRLANNLQILAPVSHWNDSAKPYKDLYTPNRILSDIYTDDNELSTALKLLIERALALPGPLFRGRRPSPVDGPLLNEIAPDCPEGRFTFRSHEFGQIAFLGNQVVPRCGNHRELAELLLDFVVNVAAREDPGWNNTSLVTPRTRDGKMGFRFGPTTPHGPLS